MHRVTTYLAATAFAVATLCADGAQAQANANLKGQNVSPRGNVVLYSAPDSGLFRKQVPIALARTWQGEVTLYALTPDGDEFVIGEPMQTRSLTVIGSRTVVRDGEIEEWLEVEAAGQRGWVQNQAGGGAPVLMRKN